MCQFRRLCHLSYAPDSAHQHVRAFQASFIALSLSVSLLAPDLARTTHTMRHICSGQMRKLQCATPVATGHAVDPLTHKAGHPFHNVRGRVRSLMNPDRFGSQLSLSFSLSPSPPLTAMSTNLSPSALSIKCICWALLSECMGQFCQWFFPSLSAQANSQTVKYSIFQALMNIRVIWRLSAQERGSRPRPECIVSQFSISCILFARFCESHVLFLNFYIRDRLLFLMMQHSVLLLSLICSCT